MKIDKRVKFTDSQIEKVRLLFMQGHSTESLAKMFNMSVDHAYRIVTNERRFDSAYIVPDMERTGVFANSVTIKRGTQEWVG